MSGLLPSDTDAPRGDPSEERAETGEGDLRVLWLDDEDADQLIGSLSSETARAVLTELHHGPATASELSEDVDTSLQNVRHHLDSLQEAGLVQVADTRYSVKGREMNVYAPTDDSLVVCVGREDDRSSFLDSLKRLVGTVTLLGLLAAVVQVTFGAGVVDLGGPGTTPRIGDAVGGTEPIFGLLPPGAAFLAGGLVVLGLLGAWELRRRQATA
jgi:DNA-binding transcriptional ArsR family regulator